MRSLSSRLALRSVALREYELWIRSYAWAQAHPNRFIRQKSIIFKTIGLIAYDRILNPTPRLLLVRAGTGTTDLLR